MTDAVARRGWHADRALSHWSLPAATAAGVAAVCAFVATHSPFSQQLSPPCVLFAHLGIYCPGCGGTRAAYDLLHGDVVGALHMNAFATVVLIPGAAVALAWWLAAAVGLPTPRLRLHSWVVWVGVAALGAFWVLRNVPGLRDYLGP